jgi:Tol biopolymer transport system component
MSTHLKRALLLPAAALVSVLVAGCGTGGKSAPSATPEPTVAPTASPQAVSASEELAGVPSGSLLFLAERNLHNLYLVNADGSGPTELTDSVERDSDFAFSPDGSLIAFTSDSREDKADGVYVISPDGANARRVSGDGLPASFISWSSQGKILYVQGVQSPGDFWIVNPDGSDRVLISQMNPCSGPIEWSPDGDNLVLGRCPTGFEPRPPCSLSIIDQQGNVVRTLAQDIPPMLDSLNWSPDGSRLLFVSRERITDPFTLFVVNGDGTDLRTLYQAPADADWITTRWSPDGSQIVVMIPTQILTVSPTDGSSRTVVEGEGLSISPDGSGIAVRKGGEIDIVSLADGSSRIVASAKNIRGFAWSPNSARIAYVAEDNALKLYVVDSDGGEPKLIADQVADEGIAWSPDGRQMLFASDRQRPEGVWWMSPDGSERGRLDELSKTWVPERSVVPTVEPVAGGCRKGSERDSCLSPDGKSEAVVSSDSTVLTIKDLTSGATRDIETEGAQAWDAPPVWSNNGTRIAIRAGDPDDGRLYVVDVATGEAQPLATDVRVGGASQWTIAWSPNDSYVYFIKGAYCPVGCGPGFLYRVRPDGTGEERVVDMAVRLIYGFKP